LVSENEPGKHLYEKASSSSNLSLSIVNIFFIHLRIKDNREVVDRYNRYYTFMKFVASDYDYQKRLNNKNPIITTSQDIPLEEELNRINFSHLYK